MTASAAPPLTRVPTSTTMTPVVAALTTFCASTALSGVIEGMRWLGYAGIAVVVVTATGLGLRAIRTPAPLVALAQMFALLCLLVALFTNNGIIGALPGPAAVGELIEVLNRSVEVVRTGIPPVRASAAVLCLVVLAIGLVAVLVDTLAVAAGTPAACGLVLLCVYAVPASLASEMLPWWSFVLGAGSFAMLLAVDGAHRHQQWRNRPAAPSTGTGMGSPVAQVSVALVIALMAGGTITAIGTVGQLPGGAGNGGGSGGLGLKPFTNLRGFLDQGSDRELFRVRGLDEGRYMRVMTLPVYDRNGGWALPETMPPGIPANRFLGSPPGATTAEPVRIQIEAVEHKDLFAPLYGTPQRIRGLPPVMRYDSASGMVYNETARKLPVFTLETDMSQPSAEDLRRAGTDYSAIADTYLTSAGIDGRVVALAEQITQGQSTSYDKAMALTRYFDGNGFRYELETATGNDEDALVDFLFRSKAGFCEQYASAMAILARAAGLASRVAMGYTAGLPTNDYRSISTQDAHAWVEIYFPGLGWQLFDPTPLGNARTYTPPYATSSGTADPNDDPENQTQQPDPSASAPAPLTNKEDDPDAGATAAVGQQQQDQPTTWTWWTGAILAVLAMLLTALSILFRRGMVTARRPSTKRITRLLLPLAAGAWVLTAVVLVGTWSWWVSALVIVLLVAGAPGLVRATRRRAHRHAVTAGQPGAPSAAWAELLAESVDRGADVVDTETVRTAARRLALEHALDDDGKRALRTIVSAVERSWYGGRSAPDPDLAEAFTEVVAGLRRSAPLALRARLLPRSVLQRRRQRSDRIDYTAG